MSGCAPAAVSDPETPGIFRKEMTGAIPFFGYQLFIPAYMRNQQMKKVRHIVLPSFKWFPSLFYRNQKKSFC